MSTYRSVIAKNPRLEMVQVSKDQSVEKASSFAADYKLPWLTVLNPDMGTSELMKYGSRYVPDYVLIKADGTKVASGPQVLQQLRTL